MTEIKLPVSVTEAMVDAALQACPLNYFTQSGDGSHYVRCSANTADIRLMLTAALVDAPAPATDEAVAWCQPNYEGKIHPRKFMVVYEDSEMGSAIFDDEAEAREHFEKASISWNCYLFGLLPRAAPQPAPSAGGGLTDAQIDAGARVVAKWIQYKWEGLSDRDISDQYPDGATNGIGALSMNGGKPALRKLVMRIADALSNHGGGDE